MMNARRPAIRIALLYAAVSLAWIALSDRLAVWMVDGSQELLVVVQTAKGWFFVAVTALLLYWLVSRSLSRVIALEREQQAARSRSEAILEAIPYGVQELDAQGTIVFSTGAHARLLGYPPGALLGRKVWDVLPGEERRRFIKLFRRLIAQQPPPQPYFGRNLTRDGRLIDVRVDWNYQRDEAGWVTGFVAVVSDVSAQYQAEARLRQAATVFECSAEAIILTDDHARITAVNRSFEALTGFPEVEVVGKTPAVLRSGRHETAFYDAMWDTLRRVGHWQGELWNRRKDGELFPAWASMSAIRDGRGRITGYVSVMSDLSQLKESQQQLEHLAHFDVLTGLPNRLLLAARLDHALRHAALERHNVAVVTVDLDRFKTINDSLGHDVGDALLREAGERIAACVPGDDTVARPGGDEFVVVLEELQAAREAVVVVERILAALAAPFHLHGHEIFVTASAGIALWPTDGDTPEALLKGAEAAMNRTKEAGRNSYQFYTAELSSKAFERLALETSLRHAIERNEFELHYQPQVDLASGHIVGVEALVRWRHPELGLVAPARFIPLAEEAGLIEGIGTLVLCAALQQAQAWADKGLDGFRIAVNLSGLEIARADLVGRVQAAIDASGIDPSRLELEITETAIMSQAEQAMENIATLRSLGACLAIDDFGTGYSSMNYLKRFAVNKLKVDRSFIRDLQHDANDQAIVRAIIALGHSLQLSVIAEGVETEGQRRFLAEAGCDEMQGYFYSVPLPSADMERLLTERPDGG